MSWDHPATQAVGVLLLLTTALMVVAFIRSRLRRRLQTSARRAIRQFRVRLDRYKLVERRRVTADLLGDEQVQLAIRQHAQEHRLDPAAVEKTVNDYVNEIVPFFSVLSYYRFGYNIARLLIRMLYRVNVRFTNDTQLQSISRDDVVLYTMNHRSNADFVVVAYVLAGRVSISYAVGEWARVWPLEYIFKSFGAYFVRRRFREPLYHTVLERYVQLITRNGVTQGIFLEGGLTRDGRLRDPKLGLLDYVIRTLRDPAFRGDIWIVPVAINYDRVLEDRSLTLEQTDRKNRPGRFRQFAIVTRYFGLNLLRVVTGNLKRYGRVSVTFGQPRSAAAWIAHEPGVLELDKPARLPHVEKLAREVMEDISDIMPVTPVPLVAAVLMSFNRDTISEADVLHRLGKWRDALVAEHREIESGLSAQDILERAWIMLGMRRLVRRDGDQYTIPAEERSLLEFYANSVRHLTDRLPVN